MGRWVVAGAVGLDEVLETALVEVLTNNDWTPFPPLQAAATGDHDDRQGQDAGPQAGAWVVMRGSPARKPF